jgi:hypothetical protein
MILFGVPKIIQSPLIIVTVSKSWNSVIEENYKSCKKNRLTFIWIKHKISEDNEIIFSLQTDKTGLQVLEVQCNASYMEVFLYKALSYMDLNNWCLLLASDELISTDSINLILFELDALNDRTTYGINRLWVKYFPEDFYFSLIPVASESRCDYQYRLFRLKNLREDRNIHSPGFKFKRKSTLNSKISLIHLIWEMESLEERISKIKKYDAVSIGAGRGKLRYYLPEIFQDEEHSWAKLSDHDQVTVKKWYKTNYGQPHL